MQYHLKSTMVSSSKVVQRHMKQNVHYLGYSRAENTVVTSDWYEAKISSFNSPAGDAELGAQAAPPFSTAGRAVKLLILSSCSGLCSGSFLGWSMS